MRYFYKLLLSALLFPVLSFAQSNYKPGYIVNLKGDTLQGFIDYKEWDKNPGEISFKIEENAAKPEIFSTKNARAFAVTGFEYYERHILSISQDPVSIGKLNTGIKIDSQNYLRAAVFLQVLNKGNNVTLYSYNDDIKQRFYLGESGGPEPQELSYHAYYDKDEPSTVRYVRRYRIQLQTAAQKYGMAADDSQISQAGYTQSDLLAIAKRINGPSSQQFTTKSLFGTRWFAGLGTNYSQLKFDGAVNIFTGLGSSAGSFFPRVTGGMDFFTNTDTRQLVLRAEYSFTINKFKLSGTGNTTPQSNSTFSATQYNNAITPQLLFNLYNKENLKIFVGAGASLNLSLYNDYKYVTSYEGSLPDATQKHYPELEQFWVSFPIRAGIEISRKIEMNICYTPASAISTYNTFSGSITSYQAGLNYLFGK